MHVNTIHNIYLQTKMKQYGYHGCEWSVTQSDCRAREVFCHKNTFLPSNKPNGWSMTVLFCMINRVLWIRTEWCNCAPGWSTKLTLMGL